MLFTDVQAMNWSQPDASWMKDSEHEVLSLVCYQDQPPCCKYITQSSCLVEHIIRLCHQLQQNVCTGSTAAFSTNQWVILGVEFFFSIFFTVMSNRKKKCDPIKVTDSDCVPAQVVLQPLLSTSRWQSNVKTLWATGTTGLWCKQHLTCTVPYEPSVPCLDISILACQHLTMHFYCPGCVPPASHKSNKTQQTSTQMSMNTQVLYILQGSRRKMDSATLWRFELIFINKNKNKWSLCLITAINNLGK